MNITILEQRWVTYLKASVFLVPSLGTLALAQVFIVPKMKQIYADSGDAGHRVFAFPRQVFAVTEFIGGNSVLLAVAVVGLLILMEWMLSKHQVYRRLAFDAVIFMINSAVLIGLLSYLIVFGMVAPMLSGR